MTYTEFFAVHPTLLLIFALILGLMVGSFLNVVIYRLPVMMARDWRRQCHEYLELQEPPPQKGEFARFNLAVPGSHCPTCRHPIGALENLPLLSYLLQRGKCRHCKAPISPRYPLLETASALLAVLVTAHFGFQWSTLAALVFTWTLLTLAMIDVDEQLLPDDLTLPLLWLGLLLNTQGAFTSLTSAVIGAVAGYLSLWSLYWAYKLIRGREGMGHGDFKLLAAIGAWLGWQLLPIVILLSSFVGAVVGIGLIVLRGRDRNVPLPFGPYLAAAGFLALLWGRELTALFFPTLLG